jgi:hypothetical protein
MSGFPIQASQQSALVRTAGQALSRHGLVHAYGHCSLRLDDRHILVSPAKPLGLIGDSDACIVVPLDGALPDGYSERCASTARFTDDGPASAAWCARCRAKRLAPSNCSVPEIAAITGHSIATVERMLDVHYLAGRAELAESAIKKLSAVYGSA